MSEDPHRDEKTEEPQLRLADAATRTRELVIVNQYLALVRLRLTHHLEDLRLQKATAPLSTKRVRKAIKLLMHTESSRDFHDIYNSEDLFKKDRAEELQRFEWDHRYGVHLLGALKSLLEIREDFMGADADDNLDYQCVEQLSPTGKWVACWLLLRGNKGKESRTPMGHGYSTSPPQCHLETKLGRILHTKGVAEREMQAWQDSARDTKPPAHFRETVSHRCHQSLCCKPDHLVGEAMSANFARNFCLALEDCCHMPERCLLPYHNTRLKQYQFIVDLVERRQDPTQTETPRNVHRRKHPGEQAGKSTAKDKRGKKPNAWRKKYPNAQHRLVEHHMSILQAEEEARADGQKKRQKISEYFTSPTAHVEEDDDDVEVLKEIKRIHKRPVSSDFEDDSDTPLHLVAARHTAIRID
jgi:hypothetical protein